jgi:hypothetical protein
MALPDDLSPDRDPRGEHPCRYCVHGYHLLVLLHGLRKLAVVAALRQQVYSCHAHQMRRALIRQNSLPFGSVWTWRRTIAIAG